MIAYANSLTNGFVWDDRIILTRQLVAFQSLGDVLLTPRDIPQYSPDYYRPVVIVSFLLDRAVGAGRPFAFHLSVVLAHGVVAALVCWYALQLFGSAAGGLLGAIAAGAGFAVHPVHSESVAWTAGRSDVLATGFLVAALIAHAAHHPPLRRALVLGALVLGALGAKETAVAVIPLALLFDVLVAGRRERRLSWWLERYAGIIVAGLVYALLRRAALGSFAGEAPSDPTMARSAADVLAAVAVYAGRLFWPVGLNAYIDSLPTSGFALAGTAVLLAGWMALVAWLWRRGEGMAVYLLAWIAVTIAPSLAIVWKIPEAPVAERYLYLPSVGFCLLLGWVAQRVVAAWPRSRVAVAGTIAVIVVAALVGTVSRNRVWHDDVSLWADTATKSRGSGFAFRNLGTAYQERGQREEAKQWFARALERHNTRRGLQITYNNLGTMAMQDQDFTAAERYYREALKANPSAADTLFNLALAVLQGGGRTADAARTAGDMLLQAEMLSPYDPDIQAALGQTYAIRGDREHAIARLRRALELGAQPATAESIRNFLGELERESAVGSRQ